MERWWRLPLIALTLGALLCLLLGTLWWSFQVDTRPPPVAITELAKPGDGADRHVTVAPAAETAPPTPDPELARWYGELAQRVADVQQECGERGLTLACEGEVCAIRYANQEHPLWGFWRKPQLVVDRLLVFGMGMSSDVSPCYRASKALVPEGEWMSPPRRVMPGVSVPSGCYALMPQPGPELEGVDTAYAGARLCNRLAADAPEAGTYGVTPRIKKEASK